MKVLLDTGIVSRYVSGLSHVVKEVDKFEPENIYISMVTFIELNNWLSDYANIEKSDKLILKKAISKLNILNINNEISNLSMQYSLKFPKDKVPDILIAATKNYHRMKILTLNTRHFDKYRK